MSVWTPEFQMFVFKINKLNNISNFIPLTVVGRGSIETH